MPPILLRYKLYNKYNSINKLKYKKQYINKGIREKIWFNHFGEKFTIKCPCCDIRSINPFSFSTGHIIPESKGGKADLNNLIPICTHCNSRMGTQNYYDYQKKLK